MEVYSDVEKIRSKLKTLKLQAKSIGFVPTMGALHNGHLELIRTSVKNNEITVCSIFVNPKQFNNPADLKNYPRDLKADLLKLEESGCQIVFAPSESTMYPNDPLVNIEFGYLEQIMEGKFRPGHFKGVGVIVAKLLNIVQPDSAYFGQKDLQQCAVIKKLVTELFFDTHIIIVDTVRENDGLAMSSRNLLLNKEERVHAIDLYNALCDAKEKLKGKNSVEEVRRSVISFFEKESVIDLEYFEIVDSDSLLQIKDISESAGISLCIAGYLGKVRLIDNMSLF